MQKVSHFIGNLPPMRWIKSFLTFVILLLVYIITVIPVGFIMWLSRKKLQTNSYWKDIYVEEPSYEQQF